MGGLRLALLQMSCASGSSMEKTSELIMEASVNGAKLVLMQELHLTKYFCQTQEIKYFDYAENFTSNVKMFSNLARKARVVLVTSLFEKRGKGIYHNTAVVFEKDGSVAGKYRKMHIPDDPHFCEKFYFTPGDLGFNPIDTSVGRLGVLVCWDQWYPEAARIMALKGADVLIYPTAIGWLDNDDEEERRRQLDAWVTIQRSHSIANGIHCASINRVGFESSGSDASSCSSGITFFGSSFVSGVQGEILTIAGCNEETILYCDIDLDRTEKTRQIWPFLRDRRVDHYSDLLKLYDQ